MRAVGSVLIAIGMLVGATPRLASQGDSTIHKPGTFYGTLKLQPLPDGINMKVLEAYSYTDASGHALSAQPGFVTDGASIPRALWSIVGSPFTGKYVGAAVIHDVGCEAHKYSWQVTDRMFYDAMLDLGVGEHLAKLMYYGVLVGGPRWRTLSLSAKSTAELSEEIAQSGAISITETSGTTQATSYTAKVVVPSATRTLTKEQVQQFDKELTRRENEHNPISLTEIDGLVGQS